MIALEYLKGGAIVSSSMGLGVLLPSKAIVILGYFLILDQPRKADMK
jgi:hypothetical protein